MRMEVYKLQILVLLICGPCSVTGHKPQLLT